MTMRKQTVEESKDKLFDSIRTLLDNQQFSTTSSADLAVQRRLSVARTVYDCWTKKGSEDAALAEKLFDGSVVLIEKYLRNEVQTFALHPGSQNLAQIDRRTVQELTYEEFVSEYLLKNQPVLIKGTNAPGWISMQNWVQRDGKINMDYLSATFGKSLVRVTSTGRPWSSSGSCRVMQMRFQDYVKYWEQRHVTNDILYLKDWHFAYSCPLYFQDDWLNDYFDSCQCQGQQAESQTPIQHDISTSDHRFVYLGIKGSWTPIHADVLQSYSWSTNLVGKKRWKLLPPQFSNLLFDRFGQVLAPSFIMGDDAHSIERSNQFPNLAEASSLALEFEQGEDEALFVPSGWYHSVENLDDTLSINHNWVNAFNIHWCWEHLKQQHKDAEAAIEDCRSLCENEEFEHLVQRNMLANCGLNYVGFANFLVAIAIRQYIKLDHGQNQTCCKISKLLDIFSLDRSIKTLHDLWNELRHIHDVDPEDDLSKGLHLSEVESTIMSRFKNVSDLAVVASSVETLIFSSQEKVSQMLNDL